MYERQDSNSKLNIFIHMDVPDDSVSPSVYTCTCTTYAVSGISTFNSVTNDQFQENAFYTSVADDIVVNSTMSDIHEVNTTVDSLLQSCSAVNTDHKDNMYAKKDLLSPVENIYKEMDLETKDEKIFQAVNEALTTGSLTPLVKEELKCSIQSRRMKEGKSELKVAFSGPKTYELSADEVVRVENRRVQNRVAAQRFRERQKLKADELQRKCHKIESHNTQLRYEMRKLRQEKEQLRKSLEEHSKVCPFVSQRIFTEPRWY